MIKKFSILNLKFSKKTKSGGFTILESIVAILILSLVISGVFSAVQQGLSQNIIAKDEIRAFYLAQEAIEVIRNKRDDNILATIKGTETDWLNGIVGPSDCPVGGICKIDATATDSIQSCSGSCENLKQDQNTFLYNHSSGNTTNINREVKIESVNADEITITVKMSWTKGIIPYTFKAKTHLFEKI